MRQRAEKVDQTRQRITEAAVRLHTTVGPSRTSIAAVAEEAGVTRLTVYRHFADLDALFEACTAHWMAQNRPPDAVAWSAVPGIAERARRAFAELYAWYGDHADELYPIYRDMTAMPISAQRERKAANRMLADALLAEDGSDQADTNGNRRLLGAVARHLVHFWTWRSLVVEQGLNGTEAVDVAVRLLTAVGQDLQHPLTGRSTGP